MSYHFKKVVFVLFIIGLLPACSALIMSPVSDADRDTQNTYDGYWKFETKSISSTQTVGTYLYNCKFVESTTFMNVKNGIGSIKYRGQQHRTNIAKNGTFRIEIPTERRFRKANGNDDVKNRVTEIYQGRLNESGASGLFVLGHEARNNTGCSTKISITSWSNQQSS